jgi:hypothetical protein
MELSLMLLPVTRERFGEDGTICMTCRTMLPVAENVEGVRELVDRIGPKTIDPEDTIYWIGINPATGEELHGELKKDGLGNPYTWVSAPELAEVIGRTFMFDPQDVAIIKYLEVLRGGATPVPVLLHWY